MCVLCGILISVNNNTEALEEIALSVNKCDYNGLLGLSLVSTTNAMMMHYDSSDSHYIFIRNSIQAVEVR